MRTRHASATARLIAAATVMAAHEPHRAGSICPGAAVWAERFLSTTTSDRLLLASVKSHIGRTFWRMMQRLTIPGIASHWIRRKQRIDWLVRQAATEGFTQLVVIGAGLDALPFRMHAERIFPHVLALDHPATQALVNQYLANSCDAQLKIELIPIDLTA